MLTKAAEIHPEIKGVFEEEQVELAIGQIYLSRNSIYRIYKFHLREEYSGSHKYRVSYERNTNDDYENISWEHYSEKAVFEFIREIKNESYVLVDRPLKDIFGEANLVLTGAKSIYEYSNDEFGEINTETAIIGRTSKNALLGITKELENKRAYVQMIHGAVRFEMEKKMNQLAKLKDGLYEIVASFQEKISKIMRVVTTIELYLGVDEELHQIKSGEKAPESEPISFRQQVLFIDEEVGIYENGGLDFQDITKFDEWLLKDNNLDIVLPEKKGIVALRPRRNDKDYGNPFLDILFNSANRNNTYLLIRNGENVYRIFTEKLVIADRLFPLRKEMQKLSEILESSSGWKYDKQTADDKRYEYKTRAMLLQGLIDRTDVFHPLPVERLNIMNLQENDNLVRFIYDDEAALPTGKLGFREWVKEMNTKIQKGSRILVTGMYGRIRENNTHNYSDRFYMGKNSSWGELKSVPEMPSEGVYEVEEFYESSSVDFHETDHLERIKLLESQGIKYKVEILKGYFFKTPDSVTGSKKVFKITSFSNDADLTFMYKPDSRGWYGKEDRKNRVRFKFFKHDEFILNYDQISVEDIDFYLKSRVDRHLYLYMMPLLKKIKSFLLEEKKNEEPFIRLATDLAYPQLKKLTVEEVEQRVRESIDWWKFKNQWKRSISKDDTLALRMILKRVTSKNYSSSVNE
jgi:hypothetical protein